LLGRVFSTRPNNRFYYRQPSQKDLAELGNFVIPVKTGIQYYQAFPGYTLKGTSPAFVT